MYAMLGISYVAKLNEISCIQPIDGGKKEKNRKKN